MKESISRARKIPNTNINILYKYLIILALEEFQDFDDKSKILLKLIFHYRFSFLSSLSGAFSFDVVFIHVVLLFSYLVARMAGGMARPGKYKYILIFSNTGPQAFNRTEKIYYLTQ